MIKKYEFASELTERKRKTFAIRLLTLVNLLKTVPSKQYRHQTWVTKNNPGHPCGTVACSLGWAVVMKDKLFPELQLEVRSAPLACSGWGIGPTEKSSGRREAATAYFGEHVFSHVFLGDVFLEERSCASIDGVKKSDVIRLLKRIAKQRYGYELA